MTAENTAPRQLKESPSQTAGPYVHIGCVPGFAGLEGMYDGVDPGAVMLLGAARGERITIEGRVFDGCGAALTDAMLEIWQADAAGLFNSPAETRGQADPAFSGWGRQATDGTSGRFRFETIRPGPVPWSGSAADGEMQAPHILVWIVARGINLGLHTRIYFEDEVKANAADPLLRRIRPGGRAATMMARRDGEIWRFDIHLQGERETVFLDV